MLNSITVYLQKNAEGQVGMQVSQGNLAMNDEEYAAWGNDDEYVWEFAAKRLNLTILGDYVLPVVENEEI